MGASGLPKSVFTDDDHRHVREIIEALQNLTYVLRIDAEDPAKVAAYLDQIDELIVTLQRQIHSESDWVQ